MAIFAQTLLPSGKALRVEKLSTRQYKAVMERVATKADPEQGALFSMKMSEELLLGAFRGITPNAVVAIPMKDDKGLDLEGTYDIDKMLDSVAEEMWLRPSYEQLVSEGAANLLELLADPTDFNAACALATKVTLGGQASAFAGKMKLVSVG